MLTAKGLLTARPRKGTTVQPSSSWNLFDTDVLRWLLERKFSLELAAPVQRAAGSRSSRKRRRWRRARPTPAAVAEIRAGFERMEAAEAGGEDTLDADIAFHIAVLNASANPFYMQFRDVVATALRTSIRFTNRFKGRTASLPAHHAVLAAIEAGDREAARGAMAAIIAEVMAMIEDAERAG